MNQSEKLFNIINNILISKNEQPISNILPNNHLKNDLGLESFDMVELVVELEDEFGVDIFEAGNVETINDVLDRIKNN
tara:strand:+ start:509 stop:742 length:234 start_codon:yes stop_codon:yes gene_type:complete